MTALILNYMPLAYWSNLRWIGHIGNGSKAMIDPLTLMIDLHHDILFFLIFIIAFVLWMMGTIIFYFNAAYLNKMDLNPPFNNTVATPIIEVLVASNYTLSIWLMQSGKSRSMIVWVGGLFLKIIGIFICFIFVILVDAILFDGSVVKAAPKYPMPEIIPEVNLTESTKCINKFCSNLSRILSTKSTRITSTVCEELFTYLAHNPEHGRNLTQVNPRLAKDFFDFVNTHCDKYVVLKPLQHTSLHTVSSEVPHLVLWHERTGEVFFKVKNELILKGADFVSLDGSIRVQAKTLLGANVTPNKITGLVGNISSHSGINGASVLVNKPEVAQSAYEALRNKLPGKLSNVIIADVTTSFSEGQANWFCNTFAQQYTPEAYDRITNLISDMNWGSNSTSIKSKKD